MQLEVPPEEQLEEQLEEPPVKQLEELPVELEEPPED